MSSASPQASASPALAISPFRHQDHADWHRLARAYQLFDNDISSSDEMSRTWDRLTTSDGIRGLGAYVDDRLVGIAHFHFHEHVWHGTVCYLEDLFVEETVRGRGAGRALIEQIARLAVTEGCFRLYWVTKSTNARARRLYDRVAVDTGYVRYDMPLSVTEPAIKTVS